MRRGDGRSECIFLVCKRIWLGLVAAANRHPWPFAEPHPRILGQAACVRRSPSKAMQASTQANYLHTLEIEGVPATQAPKRMQRRSARQCPAIGSRDLSMHPQRQVYWSRGRRTSITSQQCRGPKQDTANTSLEIRGANVRWQGLLAMTMCTPDPANSTQLMGLRPVLLPNFGRYWPSTLLVGAGVARDWQQHDRLMSKHALRPQLLPATQAS